MTRTVLVLLVGLAVLTWAAAGIVQTTARDWFERDVSSRAQLVLVSARQSVAADWFDDQKLEKQLVDLARDERVMGAAVCNADLTPRFRTSGFPEQFSCPDVGSRVLAGDIGAKRPTEWSTVASLPTGRVHISAMSIPAQDQTLGVIILLHDLTFIERRVSQLRTFVLFGFVLLSIGALGFLIYLTKSARSGWSAELRRILRTGGEQESEFQPILSDVRELVGRMAREREDMPGQWTAERLKQTLNRYLHGERIVIVSNREPYIHDRQDDGSIRVRHPASGLVTALEPVMLACSGVWVAHGAGTADRDTVDRNDHVRVPPGKEAYHIRRVWLTEEQEKGYYYGFSNEGLWPLCHVAHTRPIFRADDWRQYRAVNQAFADAVCSEVDSDDPIILVQDYHFALAPAMIRERLPAATVITFWHIPWPNAERMGICPWRDELLAGLLGSSIVGFHTQLHCNNFLDSADRFLEARIDREGTAVVQHGRPTLVRPYPISIEWPSNWASSAPPVPECRA
ncbi:MAG: trehalose-6-phosphate synthase, partial [Acidobacteriota bacterium]